jgi:guanine nucleotide-binding protein subunit alpha
MFIDTPSLEENQPFPVMYHMPLKRLWQDKSIQQACQHGNTFALHDNIS